MQISDRIYYLWQQYKDDCATQAELEELRDWLDEPKNSEAAKEQLIDFLKQSKPLLSHSEARLNAIMGKIKVPSVVVSPELAEGSHQQPIYMVRRRWFRYAAAAVLIIGIASLAVVVSRTNNKPDQSLANGNKRLQNDVAPGGNKAILTLSNGNTIILDSAANGTLAQQGNTQIVKLANGQLAYHVKGTGTTEILYNTMTTPRGGKYQLRLPDGTNVWLNSASSITYPTVFTGTNRKITITGEAYFEVAKDKTKPFIVNVDNKSEVEVLGTHFNINSYGDEGSIKTTLLEGSVKVIKGNDMAMLKPGQQAVAVSSDRQLRIINDANLDEVMAWKNGYFQFNRADIRTVMRQIARWYDVEVVYEGTVPDDKFVGELPMDANASQVLRALEKIGVHFRIEGKKIIVTP